MAGPGFDRAAEDIGNIIHLEHVNTRVPDQALATLFYISGLGLTRDPHFMTGIDNMWVNVGRSQFHLPTGAPQVLRGTTGLVIPDRAALLRRLAAVSEALAGTQFDVIEADDHVFVTSPWGNRIRVHEPGASFGRLRRGMPYVALDVAPGTAAPIARFYREVFGASARVDHVNATARAIVPAGIGQDLVFEETTRSVSAFDGHHIAIYIANFSAPHRWLADRDRITEESDRHQWRFEDIIDPESGNVLFTLEHEVRSLHHPFFDRALVNRDPAITVRNHRPEN